MASIKGIKVVIYTSNAPDAGIDSGAVYLGICDREFHLDTAANNCRRGQSDKFILGTWATESTNICNKELNNPQNPPLDSSSLFDAKGAHARPLPYIRLEGTDHWNIESVCIQVYAPGERGNVTYGKTFTSGLWLGANAGRICYIPPDNGSDPACERA
jgi:hypothetical protein